MVLRVLAAMVVDTMMGKLGLDFNDPLFFLVLRCCRYGEAEGPDPTSSESAALLSAESQAELRVGLLASDACCTLSSDTGRMV